MDFLALERKYLEMFSRKWPQYLQRRDSVISWPYLQHFTLLPPPAPDPRGRGGSSILARRGGCPYLDNLLLLGTARYH